MSISSKPILTIAGLTYPPGMSSSLFSAAVRSAILSDFSAASSFSDLGGPSNSYLRARYFFAARATSLAALTSWLLCPAVLASFKADRNFASCSVLYGRWERRITVFGNLACFFGVRIGAGALWRRHAAAND